MKRSLIALSAAALIAVTLPLAASATHKPGHQPGAGGTDLNIAAKPKTIVFGSATVISGRLTGPNNGGRTVTLRADGYPFNVGDAAVATTKTTSNGAYSFTQRPDRNTNYQVTLGAVRTERVRVNVRFRVSFAASDYTPRVGQLVRFSGKACPKSNGAVVSIQRRFSSGFRTVRRTSLKDATTCSRYGRSLRVRRDGTYRVSTDDAARTRGYSRARFLNAH